MKFSC